MEHFQNTVDKLLQKGNLNLVSINTSSWREQFNEAVQVNAGGTERMNSVMTQQPLNVTVQNHCLKTACTKYLPIPWYKGWIFVYQLYTN